MLVFQVILFVIGQYSGFPSNETAAKADTFAASENQTQSDMQQFMTLYDQLRKSLSGIANETPDAMQRAALSAAACERSCHELNEMVTGYIFDSIPAEIEFFKTIQPQFLKELFYHSRLLQMESGRPIAGTDRQKAYYTGYLERLSQQLEGYRSFYHYYRLGRSDKDERYFVRGAIIPSDSPELNLYMDRRCMSAYTVKISEIQAIEQLCEHIVVLVEGLSNPTHAGQLQSGSLVWTDKDVFLVELVIALHASGSINYGKTDMKQLVTGLEQLFNRKVTNFYQLVKSIRARKKDRTTFLPLMIQNAEKWMVERD